MHPNVRVHTRSQRERSEGEPCETRGVGHRGSCHSRHSRHRRLPRAGTEIRVPGEAGNLSKDVRTGGHSRDRDRSVDGPRVRWRDRGSPVLEGRTAEAAPLDWTEGSPDQPQGRAVPQAPALVPGGPGAGEEEGGARKVLEERSGCKPAKFGQRDKCPDTSCS